MRDIKLRTRLSKNINLSRDFSEVKELQKVLIYVNACLFSTDNQSPR